MNITVWGINYSPELTGIAPCNKALCDFLAQRGHTVRMVTSFPYYPHWHKQKEDRFTPYRTEIINQVTVHRCWQFVPRQLSTLNRILHEASFVCTSLLRQLFLPKPNVIVVISPPLALGFAAWILSRFTGAPFLFHVQDLQPGAASSLGMLKSNHLVNLLGELESFAYAKAARVSAISPGMIDCIIKKMHPAAPPPSLLPNPVTLPDLSKLPPPGRFRSRHGFNPQDFLAVYSGNLGQKQGLDILVEAAQSLNHSRVQIIIAGHGSRQPQLLQLLKQHHPIPITLLPLQSPLHYQELLVDADICLVTQQKQSGNCFFPSKLLSALAHGKPVLTVSHPDSDLANAVRKGQFGFNVEPGNPLPLAHLLDSLAANPKPLLPLSQAARTWVAQFEAQTVLPPFEALLTQLSPATQPTPPVQARPARTTP